MNNANANQGIGNNLPMGDNLGFENNNPIDVPIYPPSFIETEDFKNFIEARTNDYINPYSYPEFMISFIINYINIITGPEYNKSTISLEHLNEMIIFIDSHMWNSYSKYDKRNIIQNEITTRQQQQGGKKRNTKLNKKRKSKLNKKSLKNRK